LLRNVGERKSRFLAAKSAVRMIRV